MTKKIQQVDSLQKFLTLCFKLFRFPQEDLYFNENQYFCQLPIYPLSSPLLVRLFDEDEERQFIKLQLLQCIQLGSSLEYDKETETILQADDPPSKVRLAECGEL